MTPEKDGTHYLAHHKSGNMLEIWWSDEPEMVGWVCRWTDDGRILPADINEVTIVEEME